MNAAATPCARRLLVFGRRSTGVRPYRRVLPAGVAAIVVAGVAVAVAVAPSAFAAGEPVNICLTTTDDSGGRHVTRGLAQQAPISFAGSSGSAAQTITVNENTSFQQF